MRRERHACARQPSSPGNPLRTPLLASTSASTLTCYTLGVLHVPELTSAPDKNTLVVLRCGDTIESVAVRRGHFAPWIAKPMASLWKGAFAELDVRKVDELPRSLLGAAGLVISGSSSSVTERAPWMLRTEELLREAHAAEVPVLGICFGHQILAQALGGEVVKNPRGREIGTVEIAKTAPDPLFDGLGDRFQCNATHVDTVGRLPPGAAVLASTPLEPTAAFSLGRSRGVQFHPEIDGDVMRGYLTARRHLLEAEGLDADGLLASAVDTPAGDRILANFVERFVLPRV